MGKPPKKAQPAIS